MHESTVPTVLKSQSVYSKLSNAMFKNVLENAEMIE